MKKLVFMFVAMAAISFASCGEKKAAPAEPAVDTTAVADTDTIAASDSDSVTTPAPETPAAE